MRLRFCVSEQKGVYFQIPSDIHCSRPWKKAVYHLAYILQPETLMSISKSFSGLLSIHSPTLVCTAAESCPDPLEGLEALDLVELPGAYTGPLLKPDKVPLVGSPLLK